MFNQRSISIVILALSLSSGTQASTPTDQSKCYGTTSDGRLENGVQLPSSGINFVGYSRIAKNAGRTYVHSAVNDIILGAYADLATSHKNKVFKYAETGFRTGGPFKPHKTHQNGLSVDFMVPVVNASGTSVHLPTHALNKFGYNIEFNDVGRYKSLLIDFEAMAAHIVALHKQARNRNHDIWRVIFDPELQPKLLNTDHGGYIKEHITLSKKRSWVRHDEHYHVDFVVPCNAKQT